MNPSGSTPGRRTVALWVWAASSVVVSLFPIFETGTSLGVEMRIPPGNPIERTQKVIGDRWRFLWLARNHVPAGATYTVVSRHPQEVMELHEMALGILTRAQATYPPIYFGYPQPPRNPPPEYILSFGHARSRMDQYELHVALDDGSIYKLKAPLD